MSPQAPFKGVFSSLATPFFIGMTHVSQVYFSNISEFES